MTDVLNHKVGKAVGTAGSDLQPAFAGRRLLFVVNVGWAFLSHRLPLALAAKEAGYDVHVACSTDDVAEERIILGHGLGFHRLSITRAGWSPIRELRVLWELRSLYRKLAPQIIHHVTIKPVLYGGLLCRLTFTGRVVNAISGLGYVFNARGLRATILRAVVRAAYRFALSGKKTTVIFQNRDDLSSFVAAGLVPERNAVLIRGAGVDLNAFRPGPEPADPVTILLPARMLRDKGVFEFIAAASLLRARGITAHFVLAGRIDRDNPEGIGASELTAAASAAGVSWLGHRSDMAQMLAAAHVVCLPSYREGLPKVLLEAAAAGKPMVATDVPGCREVVIAESTGVLVPPRNSERLADALARLVADPALRTRMGQAARALCEAEFGIETVVCRTLDLYEM